MRGWLRSVNSGRLTSMRSNATSTGWIRRDQRKRRHGKDDDQHQRTANEDKKMIDRAQYTPGPATGADVLKDGDKWTLVLVRELRHSPEKVWQALTDPAQLREWAPFDADRSLGTV